MQLSPIQFGMAISIRPTKNAPPLPADELLVSTDKLYELGITNLVSNDPQNAGLQVSGEEDKGLVKRMLLLAKGVGKLKKDPKSTRRQTMAEAMLSQPETADPTKPVTPKAVLTDNAKRKLEVLKGPLDSILTLVQARVQESSRKAELEKAQQALAQSQQMVAKAEQGYMPFSPRRNRKKTDPKVGTKA